MADAENAKLQAQNLFSVHGLVVVITGGGSGLGAIMTKALALNGAAKIFILGRREDSLRKVVASVPNGESLIHPIVCDVTSKSSLSDAYDKITTQTTHIDVLVCNSGILGPSVSVSDPADKDRTHCLPADQLKTNLLASSLDDLSQVFAVNVVGVQFTVGTFLPLLDNANKKRPTESTAENFRPRPQIITTGSIGGYNRVPMANLSYGPSKAAVMHLTKQLATALVGIDVRVNSIAPGMYLSEMTQSVFESNQTIDTHNVEGTFPKSYVPATRTGDEQDMAGVILFLCGRSGAYINGSVLVTDGGRLSVLPATY